MAGHSKDYIFKKDTNGKLTFVGDFEGYYSNIEDPWEQSGNGKDMSDYYNFSRRRICDWLKQHTACQKVLEIGCGLGHSTHQIAQLSGRNITGLDISKSAILKARTNYPQHHFVQTDICNTKTSLKLPAEFKTADAILFNQVLWYIMHKLDDIKINCNQLLADNGYILFSTAFLRNQQYGREIINGFQGLYDYLDKQWNDEYNIIHTEYDNSLQHPYHDGLICLQHKP